MYVSLVEARATYYTDDKTLPSLPASMLNVLQADRTPSRSLAGTPETAQEQLSVPFDEMVSGSYSLRISSEVNENSSEFLSGAGCQPAADCQSALWALCADPGVRTSPLFAVETKTWTQADMADFDKGSLTGLSLSSEGR